MIEASIGVVCAWCGELLRDGTGDRVSHGICTRCSTRFLRNTQSPVPTSRGPQRRLCSGIAWIWAAVTPVLIAGAILHMSQRTRARAAPP